MLLHNVDFATAASQNSLCIIQEICLIMVLCHNCSLIKNKVMREVMFFFIRNSIGFLMMGQLVWAKSIIWSSCLKVKFVSFSLPNLIHFCRKNEDEKHSREVPWHGARRTGTEKLRELGKCRHWNRKSAVKDSLAWLE